MKIFPLLALTSTAFAETTAPTPETPFIGATPASTYSYLPPSRACIFSDESLEQSQLYLGLEFLYWEGGEEGLDFAFKNKGTQFQQTGTMHRTHFEWHPGVRATVGTHLPWDSWWNLDFSMTYYKSKEIDRIKDFFNRNSSSPGTGIVSVWTAPFAFDNQMIGARWTSASARWNFQTYIFDLMLRHNLCVGSALSVEPAFGLKLALLQQFYKVEYENGNTIFDSSGTDQSLLSSEIGMKNRSINIGPSFGFLSRWVLGSRWSAFGAASGSILGSRFSVTRNEFDYALEGSTVFSDNVKLSDTYWAMRPQTALQLGLTWGGCVCRPDSIISYSVSASYEAQYWWKQNMLLRYVDGNSRIFTEAVPAQGDLFLHGLNIDARLDF